MTKKELIKKHIIQLSSKYQTNIRILTGPSGKVFVLYRCVCDSSKQYDVDFIVSKIKLEIRDLGYDIAWYRDDTVTQDSSDFLEEAEYYA